MPVVLVARARTAGSQSQTLPALAKIDASPGKTDAGGIFCSSTLAVQYSNVA